MGIKKQGTQKAEGDVSCLNSTSITQEGGVVPKPQTPTHPKQIRLPLAMHLEEREKQESFENFSSATKQPKNQRF